MTNPAILSTLSHSIDVLIVVTITLGAVCATFRANRAATAHRA